MSYYQIKFKTNRNSINESITSYDIIETKEFKDSDGVILKNPDNWVAYNEFQNCFILQINMDNYNENVETNVILKNIIKIVLRKVKIEKLDIL